MTTHRPRRARQEFERLALIETDDCVIWPHSKTSGYGQIKDGPGAPRRICRIVLERRIGPPPTPEHEAAHGPCHNRACINYRHLTWETPSDNQLDRYRDGTSNHGERNGQAKLTTADVLGIRAATGSQRQIAERFNISQSLVSRIRRREVWQHIPESTTGETQ